MPKELFEIKDWRTGTLTTPSKKDLPPDAAQHSLNLDPLAEDGKLMGIEAHSIMTTSGWSPSGTTGLSGFNGEYVNVINNKGVRTLVFYDNDTNSFKSVKNLDATSDVAIESVGDEQDVSNNAYMVANNSELHIGRGDLDPVWIGYPQYKQFGIDQSNDLILEDARLQTSSSLDAFYKVVSVVEGSPQIRYFYAVKYQGQYVYKFQQSGTNAFTLIQKSAHLFGKIQGLSLRYTSIPAQVDGYYTEPVLWVYDAGVGEFGTMYKYDGTSLLTGGEHALSTGPERNFSDTADSAITDILEHDGILWFGRGYDGNTEFKDDLIWNCPMPSSGQPCILVNRTPKLLDFYGVKAVGEASDLAGWITTSQKGNFNLIPVDNLTTVESGGINQCFSAIMGSSLKSTPYASYGGGNDDPYPAFWTPLGSGTFGNGIGYNMSTSNKKYNETFITDLSSQGQYSQCDEIGPLFGNYWSSNPPEPRNQSRKFNELHGWNWTYTPATLNDDAVGMADGLISDTAFTDRLYITTKSGEATNDIPYEFHGYHTNAGWMDAKAHKLIDNNYLRSPGYGTELSHTLRHYYHGSQTEFQHTPRDWIDKHYGLVFWGSNDWKGIDAQNDPHNTKGSWVDLAGDAAEALKTGWAVGDNEHIDYRRGGQAQIDQNIYCRAYNVKENPGAFDMKSDDLISLELIESNDGNFNYTIDQWQIQATGGYKHLTGTTTLDYISEPDTIVNGVKYYITFSSTGATTGSIGFIVGNTATPLLTDPAYTDHEVITSVTDASWDGEGGTDYSTIVIQVIPTTGWDGTITKLEIRAEPHTHSIILPTSYNNLGVGTPANTLLSPIGVNYTTPGYRHNKIYPTFNSNINYNNGTALHTVDGGDQQYQEFGTTLSTETRSTDEVLSVRTGMGAMKVKAASGRDEVYPQTNSWHLNDFSGQHMPFDRHIMTVDSVNHLLFVINPLYKGYGFPTTDICEIDTGATTTHCTSNTLTIGSVTLADSSTLVEDCSTTNLWVGMTINGSITTGAAVINTGSYITSIESATSFKMSQRCDGAPAGTTDCTLIFGRYISTDQGTGGNRNVIYIYSYDQHGKMKFKGFKHITRDCLPDYRGEEGIPGGSSNDKIITATDIYCKPSTNNSYLVINTMNPACGFDSAWKDGYTGSREQVSGVVKDKANVHSILKIQYNADLTEWIPSDVQKSNNIMDGWSENESMQESVNQGYYLDEDHGWGSGFKLNENTTDGSQGGSGNLIGNTAFDPLVGYLFKAGWEVDSGGGFNGTRWSTINVTAMGLTNDNFNNPIKKWGKLRLTAPEWYTISDLSPTMGSDSIPTEASPFENDNAAIDFIALDAAARVLYVATSSRANHSDFDIETSRHYRATMIFTSIQSFAYNTTHLGTNYSGDDPENVWADIRKYKDSGRAIDHIVISTIVNQQGRDSYLDEYVAGEFRNCNPYGAHYRQGFVTDWMSRRRVKYYDDDNNPISNVKENYVDNNQVREGLPRGRFLIIGGSGHSISKVAITGSGADYQRTDPNTMAQLRAIEVTMQGKFVKHSTRKREQDYFHSTGVCRLENAPNSNPWDITAGTYTLSKTNRWGHFNSNGDPMSASDVDDDLYTPYTTSIKDQDVWLQKRSLDGPIIGWDEDIGTLFSMAGMRAGAGQLDGYICGFDHGSNTDAEDIYRCFRLQSISFMHHHPISSPLVNLFPAVWDDPHKFGGVIFGAQNRNMISARILKNDSTLSEFDTSTKRHENSNTLQTISSTHGRWTLGIIDDAQAQGKSNEIATADKIADGNAAGESRLLGIGTDYSSKILGTVTSRSSSSADAYAHRNMTMIKGISQVYDDTLLNAGPSVDYRWLITFGRDRWYTTTYNVNSAGLGILSTNADPFVSGVIGGATVHGVEVAIMHNAGNGHLNGSIYMKDPFPIGIKYEAVGSMVAENSFDVDVHLFIGNSYNTDLLTNSRNAGWSLGLMDHHTSTNANIYLNNSDSINTGGKLADTIDISVENKDSGDWSTQNDKYFYRASFLYDGYQEGPLGDEYPLDSSTGKDIELKIKIDTSNLSKRVTHLNIYRGQNSDSNSIRPLGYYRLVDSIRMDSQWSTGVDVVPTPNFAGFREITYTDTGYSGADYESSSGIPEVVDNSSLKYFYSCELNNQLYVAKIGHRMMDNGENTIAKSLPYNYDMFDITKDILRLPSTPTGIAENGMRIWVFDEGNTYKIEPSNLYIEETYQGTGCFGPDSYVSCEAGLFYCDKNNIYSCSQGFPVSIGTSIRTGGTYSWDKMDPAYLPKVGFDGKRKTVLFIFKLLGASEYYAWGYNMYAKRWDLYDLGATPISNVTNDKYGNLLYNAGGYLHQFGTDSTQHKDWEWISKRFTLGHDNVNKKFYEVKNLGDGTITYGINGADTVTGLTAEKIALADRKGKDITLKVVSGANAANKYKVDSLGLMFRRLKVTSG